MTSLQQDVRTPRLRRLKGASKPYGTEYEYKLAGLLGLRARNAGLRFQIFTNVEKARPFDDIVLRVLEPYRATVFVQLKHSDDPKEMGTQDFISKNGDFSLKKYFPFYETFVENHKERGSLQDEDDQWLCECALEEVYFVMFTNRPMQDHFRSRRAYPRDATLLPDALCRLFNTSDHDVFSFGEEHHKVWNLLPKKETYRTKFLPRLFVFDNQSHASQLDSLIGDELETLFKTPLPHPEQFLARYLAFLKDWSLHDEQDFCLSDSSDELQCLLREELALRAVQAARVDDLPFQGASCSVLRRLLEGVWNVLHVPVRGLPSGPRAAKLLQLLEVSMFAGAYPANSGEALHYRKDHSSL